MRKCKRCGEEKLLSEFGVNSSYKDRVSPYCKKCVIDKYKQWTQKRPEAYKKHNREKYLKSKLKSLAD